MSVLSPVIDYLDLATKHIYLLAGCREYHPVDDIYREIRNIRKLDESMRVFDMPVYAFGAVPKGGGKFTPRYAQFNDGWTIVPENVVHELYIAGEQITDAGESGPACLDTSVLTVSVIIHYEPPAAELIRAEEELIMIQDMSFDGPNGRGIVIDAVDGGTTIDWPAGTYSSPVLTPTLALEIDAIRKTDRFYVLGDATFGASHDVTGYLIYGQSPIKSVITMESDALCYGVQIHSACVAGTLDGMAILRECILGLAGPLNYVSGYVYDCGLSTQPIVLGGGVDATFLRCETVGYTPAIIDMGSSGQNLNMQGQEGDVKLINKTGPETAIINLSGGTAILDDTVVNGTIDVNGVGWLSDTSGNHIPEGLWNGCTTINELVCRHTVRDAILNADVHDHLIENSVGALIHRVAYVPKTVYIDTEALVNGHGTQHDPFNDFNDAKDFAEDNGIYVLTVHGEITIPDNFKNFTINGIGVPIVHTNGQDLTNSKFYQVKISGVYTGTIIVQESVLLPGLYLDGFFDHCAIAGNLVCVEAVSVLISDCFSFIPGLIGPEISMNSGVGTSLNVTRHDGHLSIVDCDHVDDTVSVGMLNGRLTFADSCVSGEMVAMGVCLFTDNTNGSSVTDETLSKEVIAEHTVNGLLIPTP